MEDSSFKSVRPPLNTRGDLDGLICRGVAAEAPTLTFGPAGCLGLLSGVKDKESRDITCHPTVLHLSVKLNVWVATDLATGDGISTRNRCL